MVVSCKNLSKRFGDFVAVNDLTMSIRPGICFGLLGPNGAGKSTLIKMLYGANSKSSGELKVLGYDPATHAREIKQKLGVVTQDNYLDEVLTVEENMLTYATYLGVDVDGREERVHDLLKFMKLDHKAKAPILSLSGGMKRRLVFVRALLADPELVILDEPTTGLDPAVRHLLWDKINELKSRGKTILLTTHYMDEAEQLCDDLVIMDQGALKVQDSPSNMIAQYCPGYLAIIEDLPENYTVPSPFQLRHRMGGHQIRGNSLEELSRLMKELELQPKLIRPTQMEDVFLEVTGRELSQNA